MQDLDKNSSYSVSASQLRRYSPTVSRPGSENSIPLAWSARAWNLLLLASSAVAP